MRPSRNILWAILRLIFLKNLVFHGIKFGVRLKKRGIKRRTKFRKRILNLNEFYFKDVKTEEQAYWLGYIYADGCVLIDSVGRKYLTFHLHSKDFILMERLCSCLGYSGKYKLGSDGYISLRICSQQLCDDLIGYGVVPRKTYEDLHMPNIPFKKDFIRGFLDGDGCINSESIGWSSRCKGILLDFRNEISKYTKKKMGSISQNKKNKQWSLVFGGGYSIIDVFSYLYKDAPKGLYLERKRDKGLLFKKRDLLSPSIFSKCQDRILP